MSRDPTSLFVPTEYREATATLVLHALLVLDLGYKRRLNSLLRKPLEIFLSPSPRPSHLR